MIYLRSSGNGIFNQLLGLEIAYGLEQSGYKVSVYNHPQSFPNRTDAVYSEYFDQNKFEQIMITDFFDTPNSNISYIEEDLWPRFTKDRLTDYYASSNGNEDLRFAMGRKLLKHNQDYIFSDSAYAYYSSFFYNRTKEVDHVLKQITPKREYKELADKVAQTIGNFNGIHLRRSDHIHVVDLANHSISIGELSNLPVFVCTDDPGFAEDLDAINMERFILNNFMSEFSSLPIVSGHTLAFLSALVMTNAADFIGTQTSTYTGYIQRNIFARDGSYSFKFFNPMEQDYGPHIHSWNAYANQFLYAPHGVALIRDWPESKFMI